MDINIKMEDCKFFVDEEKRTVVCVIEDTARLIEKFFEVGFWWGDENTKKVKVDLSRNMYKQIYLPDRFVGKAVCSQEDEWNEEVGRLIAFDRAKHKLNTSFFKRAQLLVTEIDDMLNDMITRTNEYGERLQIGEEKRLQHIKRICPTFVEDNKME